MRSTLAIALFAFAGWSVTQTTTQQSYPYTIEPDSVKKSDRQYWCDQQKTQCPLICLQQPGVTSQNTVANDCDADTLVYSCVCDNGVSPNITQYTQTLPYFICTEWGNQCVKGCNGDNTCANDCRANHPCGAQNPVKPNATTSTTSSAASKTADSTSSGGSFASATGFGSQPGAAPATLSLGTFPVMAITFVGVFAGFALL